MEEQNNPTQGELPREQIPPEGEPDVPANQKAIGEEPEPPIKPGGTPNPAPKAPPKTPSLEASAG